MTFYGHKMIVSNVSWGQNSMHQMSNRNMKNDQNL